MIIHCPHCGNRIPPKKEEQPFSPQDIQRFWKGVEKKENGCWIFTKGSTPYGRLKMGGVVQGAHIASWKLHGGKIEDGKILLHSCDTPRCVNPAHLSVGTHSENAADKCKKGRHNSPKGAANVNSKLDEEKVLYIRESLANKIETINSLAKKYGTSFQVIYHVAIGSGWKSVGGTLLKKKNLKQFTREEILEIKTAPKFFGSVNQLANKFGVHQSVISHIRNGRRWKNIIPQTI